MSSYKGSVKANIVAARFSASGKISRVNKTVGDKVKKGDIIASLDRKFLQTQLDRQLADYEKVRADFEVYAQKNPDPQSAIDKYLKAQKQATLDSSVKDVELAKMVLDECDLSSPVNGIVMDNSDIVAGLNVTPTGSEVKIIDTDSFYFEFEIEEKDISKFTETKKVKIKFDSKTISAIEGETKPVFSDGKKFLIRIPLSNSQNILLGQNGKAEC